ncbi:MAG: hypothetical protein CMM87_07185 [Rickettsiales bacterium]|nr:hypothetical protein [Rickettsiales bacterium]
MLEALRPGIYNTDMAKTGQILSLHAHCTEPSLPCVCLPVEKIAISMLGTVIPRAAANMATAVVCDKQAMRVLLRARKTRL